jgi:hypothetical protein
LIRDYDSKVINSLSPEAKDYDFAIGAGDMHYNGDVEFRTSFLVCPKCKLRISFNKMKEIENISKK